MSNRADFRKPSGRSSLGKKGADHEHHAKIHKLRVSRIKFLLDEDPLIRASGKFNIVRVYNNKFLDDWLSPNTTFNKLYDDVIKPAGIKIKAGIFDKEENEYDFLPREKLQNLQQIHSASKLAGGYNNLKQITDIIASVGLDNFVKGLTLLKGLRE